MIILFGMILQCKVALFNVWNSCSPDKNPSVFIYTNIALYKLLHFTLSLRKQCSENFDNRKKIIMTQLQFLIIYFTWKQEGFNIYINYSKQWHMYTYCAVCYVLTEIANVNNNYNMNHVIQICCGITRGRVLSWKLYAQRLQMQTNKLL